MPELIDVEIARENMRSSVKGRKLSACTVYEPKVVRNVSADEVPRLIDGKVLEDIERIAKFLVFSFEDVSVAVHLMLHGDFCWAHPGEKEKNACVAFEFYDVAIVAKDWSRWMKVEIDAPALDIHAPLLESAYGVDPLSDEWSVFELARICSVKKRTVV